MTRSTTSAPPPEASDLALTEPVELLGAALQWLRAPGPVALATVVRTWSSSPRPLGSQMAIDARGRFVGSVSGGCVEVAVLQQAQQVLSTGRPELLSFGVTKEQAWEVGLPCGGRIEVWVAPAEVSRVERLHAALQARATRFELVELPGGRSELLPPEASVDAVPTELQRALLEERSACAQTEAGTTYFLHCFAAPPRLVIVGAVHLAQALHQLAQRCGYEVFVVDPRTVFATPQRFPGATLVHRWPDEALAELALDRHTSVAILSHDAKLDDPALVAALRSPCGYIGALGSGKTQAARRSRLRAHGFDDEALARLHGPIGLSIGAVTTAEIAVSILAQVVEQRRRTG